MNTNAVIVEKLAGRRLLSGMHAFWSIGCFASAGLFSVLASLGLDVTLIATLHCAIVLALLSVFGRHLLDYKSPGGEKAFAIPRGIVIVLGILACISFLVEGAVMDWSGVLLTEVKNMDIALAGTGYAIFSVAMLIMRLLGDKTVQFLGEQKAVIGGSIVTAAGFALVVILDNLYLNALAFILIGLGLRQHCPCVLFAFKIPEGHAYQRCRHRHHQPWLYGRYPRSRTLGFCRPRYQYQCGI